MTLHILFESPFTGHCLDECRRVVQSGDALLLVGNGVYALLGAQAAILTALRAAGVEVCALAEDCAARGIDVRATDGVTTLDYAGFVDLALAHERSASWF